MIVVTDTSVVLNLCRLHREELLTEIFAEVFAPEEVRIEFERKAFGDARFAELRFPVFIKVAQPSSIPAVLSSNHGLHTGEIMAIALAIERRIADVLLDEQAARKAAISLGLRVSGLLGVLIEGKRRGLVPELRPLLDSLTERARFWIAPTLRARVLGLAGEG